MKCETCKETGLKNSQNLCKKCEGSGTLLYGTMRKNHLSSAKEFLKKIKFMERLNKYAKTSKTNR